MKNHYSKTVLESFRKADDPCLRVDVDLLDVANKTISEQKTVLDQITACVDGRWDDSDAIHMVKEALKGHLTLVSGACRIPWL